MFKNGYTGGNANVAVLTMAGVDRAEVKNCRFITKVTTAVINFTASSTAIEVHDCDFLVTLTTKLSKNVVSTAGTNTWAVWNCFDLGAGAGFSGGSGGALAVDDLGAVAAAVAVVDGYFDVPTANSTDDVTMRDVVGRKTDNANTGAVAVNKSLMAYAKQNVVNTEAATT